MAKNNEKKSVKAITTVAAPPAAPVEHFVRVQFLTADNYYASGLTINLQLPDNKDERVTNDEGVIESKAFFSSDGTEPSITNIFSQHGVNPATNFQIEISEYNGYSLKMDKLNTITLVQEYKSISPPMTPEKEAFIKKHGLFDGTNPGKLAFEFLQRKVYRRQLLTPKEAEVLANGVITASRGNEKLHSEVLSHLASSALHNPMYKLEPNESNYNGVYMLFHKEPSRIEINPCVILGDPKIDYKLSVPEKPPRELYGGIGAIMIHERMHFHMNNGGLPDVEGATYGVQYFLARACSTWLANDTIRSSDWAKNAKAQYQFCLWVFAMRWCFSCIEGKINGEIDPGIQSKDDLQPLKLYESIANAKQCVADFIASGTSMHGYRAKAMTWAEARLQMVFKNWMEGDPVPGAANTDTTSDAYINEARKIIGDKLSNEIK